MARDIRWLTTANAADMACCDQKAIRRAVRRGYLRAAHDGRGDLRFLESWIDEWLLNQVVPEHGDIDIAIDAASCCFRELSLIA
jgi:hypothetical protein